MGAGASAGKTMDADAITAAKALLEGPACKEIFDKIDFNGNNLVSTAEVDKFISESTADYPPFAPLIDEGTGKTKSMPLIRAWAHITGYVGGGRPYTEGHKDGFIHACEFKRYIHYLFLYNELFSVFEDVAEGDKRVTKEEFVATVPQYLDHEPERLGKAFDAMDANGGGFVLFDEFARYIIAHMEA